MAPDRASHGCVDVTDETLVELYVAQELSTYQIAKRVGIGRQRVAHRLRNAGVQLKPRGAGRRRVGRRVIGPDLDAQLRAWYVQDRRSTAQISEWLGVSERTVRNRLEDMGVRTRTRGRLNREDRATVSVDALVELYAVAGLSAGEVGSTLGTTGYQVLRRAHECGVPVRLGGPEPRSGPREIELIIALYADAAVSDALARHGVRPVPTGGTVYQRFPEPVPLTPELLTDLYLECGTSAPDIELLTGQPASTIIRRLHAAGIPVRPAGGRTPFRRRWRAQQAQHDGSSGGRGRASSGPVGDGRG